MSFKDEPIPLLIVSCDEKGEERFSVNTEAAMLISSIEGEIAVVSVAGMYRTGKSYLMNRILLNRSSGFQVGYSVNACTKVWDFIQGIWIWGRPLKGTSPTGTPVSILLMDSEGLGSFDKDSNYDCRIFSLSLLLSSLFIYNSAGAIDEDTINSLSLVVNLTKHIQIKSDTEEVSAEDYAVFFPKFFWVLRDFNLQLIDSDGEKLSENEYLEKALGEQSGFSSEIEEKNRVRRLLKDFFNERECWTLVRPVTNEEELQNLASLEIEVLRPEFVERAMNLRRAIFSKIKVKELKGFPLNGAMYIELAKAYVNAINSGSVPNIENAWNYISKQECQKALESAVVLAEIEVSKLSKTLPMTNEDLKTFVKNIRRLVLEEFDAKAIGEEAPAFRNELIMKLKSMGENIFQVNERDSYVPPFIQNTCLTFLSREYASIEKKLRMNKFPNFKEYEKEVKMFEKFYSEHGPRTTNSFLILCEFLKKSISEAAKYFVKSLETDLEMSRNTISEVQRKAKEDYEELAEILSAEKTSFSHKMQEEHSQMADLRKANQKLAFELAEKNRLLEELEQETQARLRTLEVKNRHEIESLRTQLTERESELLETQRQITLHDSEFEKQRALMTQQMNQNTDQLGFLKAQKAGLEKELAAANSKNAEFLLRLESSQGELANTVSRLHQEKTELEIQLEETKETLAEFQKRSGNELAELGKSLVWKEEEIRELEKKLKEKRKQDEKLYFTSEVPDRGKEQLKSELVDALEKIRKLEDEAFVSKSNLQKEKCVLSQQVSFLEIQLSDLAEQFEQAKRAHESTLKALENAKHDSGNRTESRVLLELKEKASLETSRISKQLEISEERRSREVNDLKAVIEEYELSKKSLVTEFKTKENELVKLLNSCKAENKRISSELLKYEEMSANISSEYNEKISNQVTTLEIKLEQSKRQSELDLRQQASRYEESLAHLKTFYESEKAQFDQRISEEKEKANKAHQLIVEEYEEKTAEIEGKYEEELENLRDELREQEANYQNFLLQHDTELETKDKTIENLERAISEYKNLLEAEKAKISEIIQKAGKGWEIERENLQRKIESLGNDLSEKEREVLSLGHKTESLANGVNKKDSELNRILTELHECRARYEEKYSELYKKNQLLSDEYLEHKIQSEKKLALSVQQIEFLNKKLEEQTFQNSNLVSQYEEKLKFLKAELSELSLSDIKKIQAEKESCSERLEKLKKSSKEAEGDLRKKIANLESQKSLLQEEVVELKRRYSELESELLQDNQDLQTHLKNSLENSEASKRIISDELEKYKSAFQAIEIEKNEIVSNYEKDKLLWEGKTQFLEKQKESAKRELSEALKKFEATISTLQRSRSSREDLKENELSESILSIERKYQTQLTELAERHSKQLFEVEEKLKKSQAELRSVKDKLLAQESTGDDSRQMEKRLSEFAENETALKKEISILKKERENMMKEFSKSTERDKEKFLARISELEQRLKESEIRRSSLIFEHEKEKARWAMEKDHLLNQKSDLSETISRLTKKKETLSKENERIRNEYKMAKRSVLHNSNLNVSYFGKVNINSENSLNGGLGTKRSGFESYLDDGDSHKTGNSKDNTGNVLDLITQEK